MLTSESISAIMPALIKAQSQFAPAVKAKVNPHFQSKYVPLDAVIDAIAQPLRDNGIAIVQQTDIEDARTILITRLVHESGEWIAGRYPVHPVKADPQGEGSALTYARRYALMALAGIAPEDDDGNAAVKATERQAVEKVTPLDGVWEAQSEESQAFLLKIAAEVVSRVAIDPADAADYLKSQGLDTDERAALWSRLDSKTRTALKKAHNAQQQEAA
jgi:hypothetical protein